MDWILIIKILTLPSEGRGDFAIGRLLNPSILHFLLFNSITPLKHTKLRTGIVHNYFKIYVKLWVNMMMQVNLMSRSLCQGSYGSLPGTPQDLFGLM